MSCLVQYEDRDTGQFKELLKKNKNYALEYNIDYLFLPSGYEIYPPWWRKVFLVRDLLNSYENVLWVDSDAAVVGHKHFSELFEEKHFILSPNPPMFNHSSLNIFSAPFCAGVWAVKSSPEGKAIMNRWCDTYDSTKWTNTKEGWKGEGAYGGSNYEQGAFELHILRSKSFSPFLNQYLSHVLNFLPKPDDKLRGKSCLKDIFAVHYWKGNRNHIDQHWPKK